MANIKFPPQLSASSSCLTCAIKKRYYVCARATLGPRSTPRGTNEMIKMRKCLNFTGVRSPTPPQCACWKNLCFTYWPEKNERERVGLWGSTLMGFLFSRHLGISVSGPEAITWRWSKKRPHSTTITTTIIVSFFFNLIYYLPGSLSPPLSDFNAHFSGYERQIRAVRLQLGMNAASRLVPEFRILVLLW